MCENREMSMNTSIYNARIFDDVRLFSYTSSNTNYHNVQLLGFVGGR